MIDEIESKEEKQKYVSMDLDEKIQTAKEIVRETFQKYDEDKIMTAFTGGKDSVTGDTKLYYRINGNLQYSTIEKLFNRVTTKRKVASEGKKVIVPKERIEVLSLSGKKRERAEVVWKSVPRLMHHRTSKPIYKFETSTGNTVKTTGDHSLVEVDKNGYFSVSEAKSLGTDNNLVGINDLGFDVQDTEEINGVQLSDDLLILAGLWLSDGCYATDRKFIISAGGDEETINFLQSLDRELYIQEKIYQEFIGRYGKIPETITMEESAEIAGKYGSSQSAIFQTRLREERIQKTLSNQKIEPIVKENGDVWVHSKSLTSKLQQLEFKYDEEMEKIFPKWLFLLSNRQIALFLAGFIQGDGYCNEHGIEIVSHNENIAKGIRTLLRRLGTHPHLFRKDTSKSGYETDKKYAFLIGIKSNQGKEAFLQAMPPIFSKWEDVRVEGEKHTKYTISGRKIKKRQELERKKRTVYDLEVKDTNIFIGNGIACHNSTLVAWIVKNVAEEEGYNKPPLLFVDHGQHFKDVEDFMQKISEDWGFEVMSVRNDDLIEKADEPGDKVPLEELNERNQREVKKLGKDYGIWLMDTEVGNHLLKTVPLNELIEEREIQAIIAGIRWDEQEARSMENFFSSREDPDHVRVHPILPIDEREVWEIVWYRMIPQEVEGWDREYIPTGEDELPDGFSKEDIPISNKYWHGYRSLGSEVSTDRTSDVPAWEQDLEGTVEREGRAQDKEEIMKKLRELGYF